MDRANEKFKKVLVEMIRGTIAIEELIGRKLNAGAKLTEESQGNLTGNKDLQESGLSPKQFFFFGEIFFKYYVRNLKLHRHLSVWIFR